MHKIGIVGPEPSIERILSVAKEFKHEIEFIPFAYDDPTEVAHIVQNASPEVNGWLFSGPLPYSIAKHNVVSDKSLEYCPSIGAGFFICCMQMAIQQKKILERISIDMLDTDDLEKWLAELNLPSQELYIKKYNDQFNRQEIIEFHVGLWKLGKTDGAITTAHSVYKALKSAGVPVYHNTVTRMEIRQALTAVIEKVKALYFKATQVGLVIIEFEDYDEIIEKARTAYDLQYIELKVRQALLPLCRRLNGYIGATGKGSYEIFSSRGVIEQEIGELQDTIKYLGLEIGGTAIGGIGFGETVFAAEINAHRAVSNAKKNGGSGIVIVRDDGVIIEAAGQDTELAYAFNSEDKALIEKLRQANVSIRTYEKMKAIIRRLGWHTFTSAQLAEQMAVTDRNIRRIIASLCEGGLTECIGEEAAASRGRPGKVYRLIDKS